MKGSGQERSGKMNKGILITNDCKYVTNEWKIPLVYAINTFRRNLNYVRSLAIH